MHVPTCESSLLDIVSFDDALASSGGRGDYDAEKWLYVPDYYTDYRYILGTRGNDPRICMDLTLNETLHRENMRAFEYILKNVGEGVSPSVWAAWGTIIEKRPYLKDCVLDMVSLGRKYGAKWYSAGKRSVKGHPHHPLYLRKDASTEEFDIVAYLENCL